MTTGLFNPNAQEIGTAVSGTPTVRSSFSDIAGPLTNLAGDLLYSSGDRESSGSQTERDREILSPIASQMRELRQLKGKIHPSQYKRKGQQLLFSAYESIPDKRELVNALSRDILGIHVADNPDQDVNFILEQEKVNWLQSSQGTNFALVARNKATDENGNFDQARFDLMLERGFAENRARAADAQVNKDLLDSLETDEGIRSAEATNVAADLVPKMFKQTSEMVNGVVTGYVAGVQNGTVDPFVGLGELTQELNNLRRTLEGEYAQLGFESGLRSGELDLSASLLPLDNMLKNIQGNSEALEDVLNNTQNMTKLQSEQLARFLSGGVFDANSEFFKVVATRMGTEYLKTFNAEDAFAFGKMEGEVFSFDLGVSPPPTPGENPGELVNPNVSSQIDSMSNNQKESMVKTMTTTLGLVGSDLTPASFADQMAVRSEALQSYSDGRAISTTDVAEIYNPTVVRRINSITKTDTPEGNKVLSVAVKDAGFVISQYVNTINSGLDLENSRGNLILSFDGNKFFLEDVENPGRFEDDRRNPRTGQGPMAKEIQDLNKILATFSGVTGMNKILQDKFLTSFAPSKDSPFVEVTGPEDFGPLPQGSRYKIKDDDGAWVYGIK